MFSVVTPLIVMLVAGVVTNAMLGRTSAAPSRVGVVALAGTIAVTGLVSLIVWSLLAEPVEQRCPLGSTTVNGLMALFIASGAVSGVVLGAIAFDARRQSGVFYWHLGAGIVAFVLPYIVGGELLYLGLTCTS